MEIIKVSGSTLDRVVRCPASAALPQVADASDDPNDRRDEGIAVHKFLERVAAIGRDAALAEVDEKHRAICEDIQLARLSAQFQMSQEVTFAYNWVDDTARVLESGQRVEIDRSRETVFRVDVTGLDGRARAVYVGDYKRTHGWLPSPERSFQLGGGALAAARYFNARSATVEYIRIRDDGSVFKFGAQLDMLALDDTAEKISRTMRDAMALRERVLGGFVPNVVEGGWCKYCPAKQHCPGKTAMIRAVVHDQQPMPFTIPLTPTIARDGYLALKKAKERLADFEAALYAYAKTQPIPLGPDEDGSERFFGEFSRPGNDVIDGAVAHRVIAARYGGEVANKVVTMEVTKKAITDAIREHKPEERTLVAEQKDIRAEIEKLNGITNPITTTTVEYTVSPDGEAKARKARKAGE